MKLHGKKLSSGKIIVANYSVIEMKWTITFIKYVNQPVMNAAQTMKLKMKINSILIRKQT